MGGPHSLSVSSLPLSDWFLPAGDSGRRDGATWSEFGVSVTVSLMHSLVESLWTLWNSLVHHQHLQCWRTLDFKVNEIFAEKSIHCNCCFVLRTPFG